MSTVKNSRKKFYISKLKDQKKVNVRNMEYIIEKYIIDCMSPNLSTQPQIQKKLSSCFISLFNKVIYNNH